MSFIRSLRNFRAQAIQFVLQWQAEGEGRFRARSSALMLTAAAVWLLNGLHSSPDQGSSSKQLMAAVLPHIAVEGADADVLAYGAPRDDDGDLDEEEAESTDDYDDQPHRTRQRRDAVTRAAFPYGLVFLRRIRLGPNYPVPRLTKSKDVAMPELSPTAFKYFFGVDIKDIVDVFFPTVPQSAHPSRLPNKSRRTVAYHNWGQDMTTKVFDLTARVCVC